MAKSAKDKAAAEPTAEEKRERRAEIMDELNKEGQREQKNEIAEQKAAGQGPKVDDAGAIEQMRAARESAPVAELAALESDPAVVAPVIDQDALTISLESRRDDSEKVEKGVTTARFIGNKLWIIGSGLTSAPGEVILDISRDGGSDHARFSYWAEDDKFEVNLPGLTGTGRWLIHAEQSVVDVSEGREDGRPVVLASNELELEIT